MTFKIPVDQGFWLCTASFPKISYPHNQQLTAAQNFIRASHRFAKYLLQSLL